MLLSPDDEREYWNPGVNFRDSLIESQWTTQAFHWTSSLSQRPWHRRIRQMMNTELWLPLWIWLRPYESSHVFLSNCIERPCQQHCYSLQLSVCSFRSATLPFENLEPDCPSESQWSSNHSIWTITLVRVHQLCWWQSCSSLIESGSGLPSATYRQKRSPRSSGVLEHSETLNFRLWNPGRSDGLKIPHKQRNPIDVLKTLHWRPFLNFRV